MTVIPLNKATVLINRNSSKCYITLQLVKKHGYRGVTVQIWEANQCPWHHSEKLLSRRIL